MISAISLVNVLAPVLLSVFINNNGKDLPTAKINLYVDDTVIYSVEG